VKLEVGFGMQAEANDPGRVVAFSTDRKACARILEHLGLPSRFPPLGKA